MIKYLKENEDFKEVIKEGTYLVDFYADWCGPCKMLGRILENIEEDINILKINTDKFQELAQEFAVMSIPTIIFFKDGEKKDQHIGFIPEEEIKEIYNKIEESKSENESNDNIKNTNEDEEIEDDND